MVALINNLLTYLLTYYNYTGAFRRDQTSTVYATLPTIRDRGISVLNHCLEWDKFV